MFNLLKCLIKPVTLRLLETYQLIACYLHINDYSPGGQVTRFTESINTVVRFCKQGTNDCILKFGLETLLIILPEPKIQNELLP